MIGTKLYQKKSRVIFFLVMYGILAVIAVTLIAVSLHGNQNPSGVHGFTLIFSAGMVFLTWRKSAKPRVVIHEKHLELNQQNKPIFVTFKNIANATRTRDNRLVIAVREGHTVNNVTVWLKDLENSDADRLVEFCQKKGWKAG